MKDFWKEFAKGIIITNPVFVLVLGLCPTLAVSISLDNALGMGMGVIFVLLGSNIIISLIRKITPIWLEFQYLLLSLLRLLLY